MSPAHNSTAAFVSSTLSFSLSRHNTTFTSATPLTSHRLYTKRRVQNAATLRMGLLDTLKSAISGSGSDPEQPIKESTLGSEQLQAYNTRVQRINALEDNIESLDDSQLAERIAQIRQSLQSNSQTVDAVLEQVFAIVREATFRVLGIRHYDVQLVGGMALHDGCIAEMATGEGKTIVAALPSCLNALAGEPVFVVTVNDYLAKRDAELIGQIHRFLGLSVGLIQTGMKPEERRQAYSADITYVTNSELGFDYLRDNLAMSESDIVISRPLGFCIVDEADSILIDEARTPLIISGKVPAQKQKYATARKAADALEQDVHYTVNEKEQSVVLTERGYADLERALGVTDLFDATNPWASFIVNAVKAKEVFQKDVNYIVAKDDESGNMEIQIVDEFTGRVMKGRRWSGGLHQAVEAKEDIVVDKEASTVAKISYQAFFKLFNKLAGMTGTAATEAKEIQNVYNLPIVVVPTALPAGRKDYPDVVFKNAAGKYTAIMREIARVAPTGRPILIGTTSVEASETLSKLLEDVGVDHEVLNAKPESALRESEIIAQAGRKYSITIATNMAGRGTDILLGGNADYFARALARRELVAQNEELYNKLSNPEQPILIDDEALPIEISEEAMDALRAAAEVVANSIEEVKLSSLIFIDDIVSVSAEFGPIPTGMECLGGLRDAMNDIKEELSETVDAEREEVLDLGGLYIIGTERGESRRVDNQLRGRAGRQGDPGGSRFFLALDDRLFRLFGGEKVTNILETFRVDDETPIENPVVNSTLDSAQTSVEAYFRDIRDQLFTYDEVLSKQRSAFYADRRRITTGDEETLSHRFRDDCIETVQEIIPAFVKADRRAGNNYEGLSGKLLQFFSGMKGADADALSSESSLEEYIISKIDKLLVDRRNMLESSKEGMSREICRYLWLTQMDNSWQSHMKSMDYLKEFIVLRSYASDDPLQAYQVEGFKLFNDMLANVRRNTVYSYFQFRSKSVPDKLE